MSFGRWPDGNDAWQYMATPTPGKPNKQGYLGVVADVEVSPHRGFYDAPIDVTLTTNAEGPRSGIRRMPMCPIRGSPIPEAAGPGSGSDIPHRSRSAARPAFEPWPSSPVEGL